MMIPQSFPSSSGQKKLELAQIKIIEGPQAGKVFSIFQNQVRIGRGEECNIILQDLRASRIHVEIANEGQNWSIRDLGSSNGFILNGKVRGGQQFGAIGGSKEVLRAGDKVRVGETLFEFKPNRAAVSSLRVIPGGNLALPGSISMPSGSQGSYAEPSTKRSPLMIVILVGLLVVFFFFDSGPKEKSQNKLPSKQGSLPNSENTQTDLAQFLPQSSFPSDHSADSFVKIGLREYFLGNYMRAKQQFSTALQVDPRHPLAKLYFDNSTRALQRLVDFHRDQARKSIDAGRIKIAMNHYQSVIRILAQEPENSAVQEAKDRISELKKKEEGKL